MHYYRNLGKIYYSGNLKTMKNENKDNLTLSLAGVLENQSLNLINLSRVSNPPIRFLFNAGLNLETLNTSLGETKHI